MVSWVVMSALNSFGKVDMNKMLASVTSWTCLGLYSDPNLFRNLLAPQDTLHPTRSWTLLGPEHFPDILMHTHAKSPLFLFTILHTLVYIHSPLSRYH